MSRETATDIGFEHSIEYYRWSPEDNVPNRELYGEPLPNVEKAGVFVYHRKPDGAECVGSIAFDTLEMRRGNWPQAMWQVESWEPLTVSPSLLCSCGDHGFIREGKWVVA